MNRVGLRLVLHKQTKFSFSFTKEIVQRNFVSVKYFENTAIEPLILLYALTVIKHKFFWLPSS